MENTVKWYGDSERPQYPWEEAANPSGSSTAAVSGISKSEVQQLIQAALEDYTPANTGVTESEVQGAIQAALKAYTPTSQMRGLVGNLLDDAGASSAQIQQAVEAALKANPYGYGYEDVQLGYVTKEVIQGYNETTLVNHGVFKVQFPRTFARKPDILFVNLDFQGSWRNQYNLLCNRENFSAITNNIQDMAGLWYFAAILKA